MSMTISDVRVTGIRSAKDRNELQELLRTGWSVLNIDFRPRRFLFFFWRSVPTVMLGRIRSARGRRARMIRGFKSWSRSVAT